MELCVVTEVRAITLPHRVEDHEHHTEHYPADAGRRLDVLSHRLRHAAEEHHVEAIDVDAVRDHARADDGLRLTTTALKIVECRSNVIEWSVARELAYH